MEVKRYLFDSPSSNQVQIGKLDTSVKKEETTQKENVAPVESINNSLKSAQNLAVSPSNEATTSLTSSRLLDIYA